MRDVLVGRAEELALVEQQWRERRAGMVVAGSMGVGKSKLLATLLQRLESEGVVISAVRASASTRSIAFGPFASLIDNDLSESTSRAAVLARLGESFEARSSATPCVVAVDDAHELDDGSAALLLHLAGRARVFVVITLRSGMPCPDAVRALWKEGLLGRVDLQPLSRSEVGEVVAAALDGPVDRATVQRLADLSGGNPLLLTELIHAGIATNALARPDRVWLWKGTMAEHPRLSELVAARLSLVPADIRHLLDNVALGEPLPIGLVPAHLRPAIEEAVAQGLLVADPDLRRTSFRVAHPVYGEVLRSTIDPYRTRSICAALADGLAGFGARRTEDLLRLGAWRLESGRVGDEGPDALVAAARRANGLADHSLAERLATLALLSGAGPVAAIVRADALYWQGRFDEAAREVGGAWPGLLDPTNRAEAAIIWSSTLFWGLGRTSEADGLLQRAEAEQSGASRHDLRAHRAAILLYGGQPLLAAELACTVLTDQRATATARVRALAAAVPAWAVQGRLAAARGGAAAGLGVALELTDELAQLAGELAGGDVIAVLFAGLLGEARSLAESVDELAVRSGADDFHGVWAMLRARVELSVGAVEAASSLLAEAITHLRDEDPGGFLPWALALDACAAAWLGDVGRAETAAREAREREHPGVRLFDTEVEIGCAWADVCRGELSSARRAIRVAAERAASSGVAVGEAFALHELVRLGESEPTVRRLSELAGQLEGPMPRLYSDHATALARGNASALLAVSEAFEATGAMLLAAECAAEASIAYSESAQQGSSSAARVRAQRLAAACGPVRTPSLRSIGAPGDLLRHLTDREREVVALAGSGLTNRAIAERLSVSIRTVNNHLNHAYAKLGVGRDELPSLDG